MDKLNYTLIIDRASHGNSVTGTIIGIEHGTLCADDLAVLMNNAGAVVQHNLLTTNRTGMEFTIHPVFSSRFIAKEQLDNPELDIYKEVLNSNIAKEKSSYDALVGIIKVLVNSLIIINGGAILAVIAFYGHFISVQHPGIDVSGIARNISHFALSLALAISIAGLWCIAFFLRAHGAYEWNARSVRYLLSNIGFNKIKNEQKAHFMTYGSKTGFCLLGALAFGALVLSILFFYNGCEQTINSIAGNLENSSVSANISIESNTK